ncbi:MAG: YceI family protein [Chlorobi bacterium]|nr:YceI family protein [Chlorobiota bacterium]
MKKVTLILAAIAISFAGFSQKTYITKNAYAKLFSHTVAEDISAENYKVISKINIETGDLIVSVPVQSFTFEKALMQKHFNMPNFMDSKQFPKIKFKGKFDASKVDFTKDGKYPVTVTGNLTIRAVTKPISQEGTITVKDGKISANSVFIVKNIFQYGVGKPTKKSKRENIAEDIKITFRANY